MREIKFRAWENNSKKMIYGGSFFDVSQTPGVDRWVFGLDVFNHPDNVELMQYTGLKSKSGQEVYEGDILQWSADIGYVYFADGKFEATSKREGAYNPLWSVQHHPDSYPEVIGNIWENPELLTPNGGK